MFCLATCIGLSLSLPLPADAPTEYDVKAAFLFKFVSYVDWPREAIDDSEFFEVGILGENPFEAALLPVFEDKKLLNRPVRIRLDITLEEAEQCHLVFVSSSESANAKAIAEALAAKAVLTVGDEAAFAEAGLIMAFETIDQRVRFVVNAGAAEESPLDMSSRLMEVARIIRQSPEP